MKKKTQNDYIKLASNFYKKKLPDENLTPKKITDALAGCANEYRPAYWRKLRNAIALDQKLKGYKKAADRINETKNPLTAVGASESLKRQVKVKQKRVKDINIDDLKKLLKKISDNRGGDDLKAAILIAKFTGCRPVEMLNIKIISDTKIFIKGAKGTEKGDRGLDRYLTLEAKDVNKINAAVNHLIASEIRGKALGLKNNVIKRTQSRLNRLTKTVFPRRKSNITLYSFRHQLGSDLKASSLDRVSIAYMMGHQSTSSVDVYGNKRKATGKLKIKPGISMEQQLAVVRINHKNAYSMQQKQVSKGYLP